MWRIVHAHKNLSVVVLIVHQHGIFTFKCKRQPPVAADLHRPVAFKIAVQGMKLPSGCVHVLLGFGIVQRGKLQFQFIRMLWLNFRLRPGFEELLDALMPEALYHRSVYYHYTVESTTRLSARPTARHVT